MLVRSFSSDGEEVVVKMVVVLKRSGLWVIRSLVVFTRQGRTFSMWSSILIGKNQCICSDNRIGNLHLHLFFCKHAHMIGRCERIYHTPSTHQTTTPTLQPRKHSQSDSGFRISQCKCFYWLWLYTTICVSMFCGIGEDHHHLITVTMPIVKSTIHLIAQNCYLHVMVFPW